MTVSSDSYIQNITDATGDIMNQEFTITFPVFDEDDIWVWTKATATGVLTKQVRGVNYEVRISGTTGTLVWIGATPHYNTATIRVQRHMKRVQQDEYRTNNSNATPQGYQKGLDSVAMMNQQSIAVDTLQPKNWSGDNDRISNLETGTASSDAVNKAQVDTAVGGGTTPLTIDSGDVGKWATANSGGTYDWSTFSSLADPKGQEFKYYTGTGWTDIDNLATITGSGDNNKLLMDIDGTATWTSVVEWATSFDPSVSDQPGRVYAINLDSGTYKDTVRDYHAAPQLLENKEGRRLTAITTGYDAAIGLKNEYSKDFKITRHAVTCSKKLPIVSNYYSGLGESGDHPVYLGTVPNITGNVGAVPYFNSRLHYVDPSWWVSPGNTNMGLYQEVEGFAFVFNIVSITTSTVTFVAASLLQEGANLVGGGDTVLRFMQHPETMTISFNILWYREKA